jgi:hypothetical protein
LYVQVKERKDMRKIIVAVIFSTLFPPAVSLVKAATAATTILSGGGSLRANYEVKKTEDDTTDDWDSSANAFLEISHSRQGEKGFASISYRTNVSYDLKDGTAEFSDHLFRFNGRRKLSPHLQFSISDSFIFTNDLWGEKLSSTATGISEPDQAGDEGGTVPDTPETQEPTLSEKIGRDRFWSNNLSTHLAFQYSQRGSFTLGYGNSMLEYDDSQQNDFQRHTGAFHILQGLGPRWSSGLSFTYTDANFEEREDFVTHDVGVNLGYRHSVRDSFSGSINYAEKKYDTGGNRNDNYIVSGNLGWVHGFSPQKTLYISGGPSYYHEDNGEDKLAPNISIDFTSNFEHGSWFLGARSGFSETSFQGYENADGISKYQLIQTGVSWQVAENITAGLGANIRNDSFEENPPKSDEMAYSAYGNITYRFWRWFYLSGRYYYVQVDSDMDTSDSEEHRFFITLGASGELYRWQ